MIEAIASEVSETSEALEEGASEGFENNSPFADSARPTEGNMELPKLKDSDQLSDTKRFSDSDRPSDSKGIEQPQLKSASESQENIPAEKDKAEICEETGWSKETVDMMKSKKEAEIYKNANLQEVDVGDKKCLIRSDIDMDQKDEFGRTNKERMENGNPPLTKDGETIELHHIGQKQDSPLAELTTQEHRGKGNDAILHDKQKESEIDRNEFAKERKQHWESRANNS